MSSENQNGYRIKCPSCGATYRYAIEKVDGRGTVQCQNCAARISVDSGPMKHFTAGEDTPDDIVPSMKPFLTLETSEGVRIKCPHCGAKYIYKEQQKLPDGRVKCQNCGVIIDAIGEEVVVYQEPADSDKTTNFVIVLIAVLVILFVPLLFAVPIIICIAAFKFCGATKTEGVETGFYSDSGQGPSLR